MSLAAGTKLGPYEILSPLGTGGMGEVYRARDARLGREVALKVLPASIAEDPERLRRFEQEAKATGALNHPNILAIYDVGTHEGCPYIVCELLEGETLRQRLLAGALPPRKAVDYGAQVAEGLAAAHEKGIVHRDLKPENLFITRDGRVKILDFGLAKLRHKHPLAGIEPEAPTVEMKSTPGSVLGTVGYMSPEQVLGAEVDHRSDIFSFGAILYEMLVGHRAFKGDSAVETLNAILKEDPPSAASLRKDFPEGLDRVIRHCIEKNPGERFQSARDVAFDLQALSGLSHPAAPPVPRGAGRRWRRLALGTLAAAALAVLAFSFYMAGRRTSGDSVAFRQLTFRKGEVRGARFSPDGRSVIYSAAWTGRPYEIFISRPGSPDSIPLGLTNAKVLSTFQGEMAVLLIRPNLSQWPIGMLARVPLEGGSPREILDNVLDADWSRDGSRVAVSHRVGSRCRLESPIGKTLFETGGVIEGPRLSPASEHIAFLHHPNPVDSGGMVCVIDGQGKLRQLTERVGDIGGIAWSADGREIWYTAALKGTTRDIYGVTLSGKGRTVTRLPGSVTLEDISADGQILVTQGQPRWELRGLFPGETQERDISWLDGSCLGDLSADARTLLFFEQGQGARAFSDVYIRKTDGAPPTRLGEGYASAISPDQKWVLCMHPSAARIVAVPTGAGEPKDLSNSRITEYQFSGWCPDGKRILFMGNEKDRPGRFFVQDFPAGRPRPVTPEGCWSWFLAVSPDGRTVVAPLTNRTGLYGVYPLDGGEPVPIHGVSPEDWVLAWSGDGESLFVWEGGDGPPIRLARVNPRTGARTPWKVLQPADPSGVNRVLGVSLTPDGAYYAYNYRRLLSTLFLVEGLR